MSTCDKQRTTDFGTIQVQTKIQEHPREKIKNFSDVKARYSHLSHEDKEHLYAVYLTNGNEEIGDELIGLGSNDKVSFCIKDIARTAVTVNAAAVILIHNHPSGNPEPTVGDEEVTREIDEVLELLGIELLDHVVFARDGTHSMRAHSNGPFDNGGVKNR